MKMRLGILMDIPEVIGVMGLAIKPTDPDEDEDVYYNIKVGGIESRIEIISSWGMVRATYKGDTVFEGNVINYTQMIALIEESIRVISDRYKIDGVEEVSE